MTEPFPFVGAGDGSYFEWAELHVRFARPPKPAEQKKISAKVPVPLRAMIAYTKAHLLVASSQGVGRLIAAAYATPVKAPAKLTTAGKFTIASGSKYKRFDADIEAWLHHTHAIVPILVAYRRQDWEAGGTKLSRWHHASLAKMPTVLPKLTAKAEQHMREGIARELAAAEPTGPSAEELVDTLMRAVLNIRQRGMLAKARAAVAALTTDEAWWLAADELADSGVACHRDAKVLALEGPRALVLDVMRHALAGATPADHVRAFQFRIDAGYQAWRLPRILAIACEAALRAGDKPALAHFAKGLDRKRDDQRSELERAAVACDEEGLPAIAKQLRALANRS